jgi:hypothetical protein
MWSALTCQRFRSTAATGRGTPNPLAKRPGLFGFATAHGGKPLAYGRCFFIICGYAAV